MIQTQPAAAPILEQPHLLTLSEEPVLDPGTFGKPYVLNAGVADYGGSIILLSRAQAADEPSSVWMAVLEPDGLTVREASRRPVLGPGSECVVSPHGVEDVRITPMRDGRYIITANSLWPDEEHAGWWLPQIAIVQTRDFEHFDLVGFPFPGLATKNATLFPDTERPERYLLHRVQPDIWLASTLDPSLKEWPEPGHAIMKPPPELVEANFMRWIGAGSQPILTERGWFMVYHSGMWISEEHGEKLYMLWLALLDREDPYRVLARSREPIYWPLVGNSHSDEDWYSGVSFTCGALIREEELWVYVTLNDSRIHLGKMPMRTAWQMLDRPTPAGGDLAPAPV
ncbi:MAG: hypothetical protein HY321_13360 [Armatimonadetes bacterium]|nr:hypothetical protein [Armatimonadota bacterium]